MSQAESCEKTVLRMLLGSKFSSTKGQGEQTVSSLSLKFRSLGGTTQTQCIRISQAGRFDLSSHLQPHRNQTPKSYWLLWNFPKKLNFLFLAPGVFHMLLPPHGRYRIVPPTDIPRNHFMWKTFPDSCLPPNTESGVLFHVCLFIYLFSILKNDNFYFSSHVYL